MERTAKRGDRKIDLLPREFRLLEYMMRRKDQMLTRAMLLEEVWKYKFVPQTNLVDVHMGRLRRKVDEPHEPPMIHNVRGVGFISVRLPDFARTTTFRWTLAVAGAFVLCTLVLFGFVYWQTAAYMTPASMAWSPRSCKSSQTTAPERRLGNDRGSIASGSSAHQGRGPVRRRRSSGSPATSRACRPALRRTFRPTPQVVRVDNRGRESAECATRRAPLPNGEVLVIGRNIDELAEIAEIVERASRWACCRHSALAVFIGMVLSRVLTNRVAEVNRRIQRIVAGDLRERLPTRGRETRSTSSPSASTECWTRLKLSSMRLPASATTSRMICARR